MTSDIDPKDQVDFETARRSHPTVKGMLAAMEEMDPFWKLKSPYFLLMLHEGGKGSYESWPYVVKIGYERAGNDIARYCLVMN